MGQLQQSWKDSQNKKAERIQFRKEARTTVIPRTLRDKKFVEEMTQKVQTFFDDNSRSVLSLSLSLSLSKARVSVLH